MGHLWVALCRYGFWDVPMGLGGLPMGLGASLWGCRKPTEGFYGAQTHRVLVVSVGFKWRPCRVLVRCPYGSWGVPMGFGVFSVGLWVSLWVLGCPYGAVGSPQRAFMGLKPIGCWWRP